MKEWPLCKLLSKGELNSNLLLLPSRAHTSDRMLSSNQPNNKLLLKPVLLPLI